jgi:nucleolar protein 56
LARFVPLLLTTWHGTHLLAQGESGQELLERVPAPQDAAGLAARLARVRRGEVLEEERELAGRHKQDLVVLERRLSSLGRLEADMVVPEPPVDPAAEGYPSSLLHEALVVLAVEEAHGALGGPDLLIVHEVRALNDVVRSMNLLAERLREWYAMHAPEVNARIKDHGDLARLVAKTPDPLEAARVAGVDASGLGVAAPEADAALVARFASGYVELMGLREDLESRLEQSVRQVAPAMAELLSPNVAARMIAQAGGLEKLAYLPAGTLQTLGAETALFRHLREGASPPKHGILFQHEAVYQAPWWLRGRIARALSGKVALAARSDLFGGDPETGKRLREAFDERVKEARSRYPAPPRRPGRGPKGRPGGGGRPRKGKGPGGGRR